MGFRPPLDLSNILALHKDPLPSPEEVEGLRQDQTPDDQLRYEKPVRLGWGPARWSTSMALVPMERVCHDVNGYYRELEVDWRATKKELKEAYQAKDGQSSARLTYVFKQLLDPVTREVYDKSPKGELFLDDYTEDDLKRRAHEEAARRSGLGQTATRDDVLDDWGYKVLDDTPDGVDSVKAVRNDRPRRAARTAWGYSYWAWQTKDFVQNESRLRQWQELLAVAAAQHGEIPEVVLGVTSMSDQPYMLEDVAGDRVVFFSTETEPTAEIAVQVIEALQNPPQIPQESFAESENPA
jgi:hypothetical protein